jgi:hypothetical protein
MFELVLITALWNGTPVEIEMGPTVHGPVAMVGESVVLDAGDVSLVLDLNEPSVSVVEGEHHWQAATSGLNADGDPSFQACLDAAHDACVVNDFQKRICWVKYVGSEDRCEWCCMDALGKCDHCPDAKTDE